MNQLDGTSGEEAEGTVVSRQAQSLVTGDDYGGLCPSLAVIR